MDCVGEMHDDHSIANIHYNEIMSLTQLSIYFRKYYPYAIVGVLLFLIIFYAVQLTLVVLESKKQKPLLINPIFNQLKRPYLSEATPSGNLKYTLDTIEGKPVTATKSAQVLFMPQAETKFGYREKLYLIAKTLGFDTEAHGYNLIGSEATFTEPNQKISIDIKNFNFNYQYFFEKDKAVLEGVRAPNLEESIERAVEFLQTTGRYPEELSRGKTNVLYLKYDSENNSMEVLSNNLQANLVEVDFYRPDVEAHPNAIPMVSPKYFNSQNYVLMMFRNNGSFKILRAQIKFFDRSAEQIGVYPLRSGEQAFEDLKKGKGIVIAQPKTPNITIRKMFLGYFDPDIYQEYLQPVYVFLGDGDFVGYVPAVSGEYLVE